MDLIESSRALLELITFLALIAMAQLASAMPSSNGAGTETTLEQINSQKSNQFERQSDKFMQLHLLELGNNVTCNDGSQAGYYKRLNGHSKSWTIYLEGGGFCGSEESCQLRWQRSPQLMSSKFWPKSKQGKCRLAPHGKGMNFVPLYSRVCLQTERRHQRNQTTSASASCLRSRCAGCA